MYNCIKLYETYPYIIIYNKKNAVYSFFVNDFPNGPIQLLHDPTLLHFDDRTGTVILKLLLTIICLGEIYFVYYII